MDAESDDPQLSSTNEMIDKVTLELLMNKSHYKRYVAITDPAKHAETVKHNALIAKYNYKLTNLTNDLLNDPSKQITTDVNEAFNGYVKTLIQYFQMKELEHKTNEHSDEEDVLFGDIDDNASHYVEPDEAQEAVEPIMKSFWGGHQVIKRNKHPR